MGRRGARLGAALIVAVSLAVVWPAPAAVGCQATSEPVPETPATPAMTSTCWFIATGNGDYIAAMNGQWEIVRQRGLVYTQVAVGAQPRVGAYQAQAGDKIIVRIINGSGAISAGER